MSEIEEKLHEAVLFFREMLNNNPNLKIVALSGSGISKGSGIPTFRGKDGLWKKYNAMDLATPHAFKMNPKLVWEWYSWRMGIILSKEPNPAHHALVSLENKGLLKWIITQNVDSLHLRAGSKNVLEVHGNIFKARCEKCGFLTIHSSPPKEPPKCNCGNLLRPSVVWFGESLDYNILVKCYEVLLKECDVLFVIGTSGVVYPVAEFPFLAKENGSMIIEFNVEPTPITSIADYSLFGKSEETLNKFIEKLLMK